MYPFHFSFMVQFVTLIISRVTSYVGVMNEMEMLRNESVKYQLIYHVCLHLAGLAREISAELVYWQVWEWEHYESEMFLLRQLAC